MLPCVQLLKRVSQDRLDNLFDPCTGELKEQAWTEEEIASLGLNVQTVSSGWFVGVEAEWDDEWWADRALDADSEAISQEYADQHPLHPPNRAPTSLDLLEPGVKLKSITVAYFDHPDDWTTHERAEAEGLMDFYSYDTTYKMGTYAQRPSKKGVNGEIEMKKEGRLHKQVYYYWGRQFNHFYPGGYKTNLSLASDAGLPSWENLERLIESSTYRNAFASNLTVTHSGFANVPHKDNDKDSFTTTGCWMNTYNDQLTHPDQPCPLQGGNLVLREYGLIYNFFKNPGLTWLSWNGARTLHFTTLLKNPGGDSAWDQYRSSMQVAASLWHRKQDR
ncbi:hypothetical protein JCM1840_000215 [Sporobolomyces johnsonii]